MEISVFISRCLTYGIRIAPFQQKTIIKASEQYKIPDRELEQFSSDQLNKYVKALDYATREDSRDWSQGLSILEELGFKKQVREEGHRNFISMVWVSVKI